MARWLLKVVGTSLAGAALAAPAAAQTAPTIGQPGSAAPAADGLSVDARGEVLYDSNVVRTSGALLNSQTDHRDDFHYTPSVSGTYGRDTGVISLALNALAGRDFFQYHRYLDSNRYNAGGSLGYHNPSGCQVAVNGNVSRRQAGIRDAESVVVDPSNVPADDVGAVIDNVLTSSLYGASVGCGSPTGRLEFSGGYTHSSLSNAAVIRQFGNSEVDTFTGNIGVGIFRPGQLWLNGSYTTIAYPDRVASAAALGVPPTLLNTGVKTYRVGIAFSRPIGPKLNGQIGLSYLHSDPTGGQAAYDSPAYTLAVNYIFSQLLTFTLSGSRDIVPSTTAGALFRVVDQVRLSGIYSLGTKITINANVGLIGNNYKEGFAIVGEPARSNDTTITLGGGVTYAPRTLYDVSFNVTQTMRESDPSIFDYSSTRVGLVLAVHY